MESAASGAEQFMYRTGQLKEKSNIFWSQEFTGHHGLKSVSDIPFVTIDTVCRKKLSSVEYKHYQQLINYISPIVKDSICYHLISMIMLLDTTNIKDDDRGSLVYENVENTVRNQSKLNLTYFDLDQSKVFGLNSDDNVAVDLRSKDKVKNTKRRTTNNAYLEIKTLQRHYIDLFHHRCLHLNNPDIRSVGDTDEELKKTMSNIKCIEYYISLLVPNLRKQ